jgi:hypothetical protein
MKTHSLIKALSAVMAIATLTANYAQAADWVVQVAGSSREDWLQDQAKKLAAQYPNVRVMQINGDAKLVVGNFPSPREASATLNRIRETTPGAFLRQLDTPSQLAATPAAQPSYQEAKTVYSENQVAKAVVSESSAPLSLTYNPNLWIKR